MKVLVVCSFNRDRISPFISQQVESLQGQGVGTAYFLIKGIGIAGYLSNLLKLYRQINLYKPDLVHAHYGLSGLLACLQHKVPVITTFHGSDINLTRIRLFSKIALKCSVRSVFVSQKLADLTHANKDSSIIPCGIDLNTFFPVEKSEARQKLRYATGDKLVLFSGPFDLKVKNYPLALAAINQINHNSLFVSPVKLLELKGYSREQVNLLLNASDAILLTSFSEGSPNIVKEAMACNRPIVSTDVGDVQLLTKNIPGCFIAKNDPADVANKIKQALEFDYSNGARQRIIDLGLEINETAKKIVRIYKDVLRSNKNGHKF